MFKRMLITLGLGYSLASCAMEGDKVVLEDLSAGNSAASQPTETFARKQLAPQGAHFPTQSIVIRQCWCAIL